MAVLLWVILVQVKDCMLQNALIRKLDRMSETRNAGSEIALLLCAKTYVVKLLRVIFVDQDRTKGVLSKLLQNKSY